jgi:hypothetical protein
MSSKLSACALRRRRRAARSRESRRTESGQRSRGSVPADIPPCEVDDGADLRGVPWQRDGELAGEGDLLERAADRFALLSKALIGRAIRSSRTDHPTPPGRTRSLASVIFDRAGPPCAVADLLVIDSTARSMILVQPECAGDAIAFDRVLIRSFAEPVTAAEVNATIQAGVDACGCKRDRNSGMPSVQIRVSAPALSWLRIDRHTRRAQSGLSLVIVAISSRPSTASMPHSIRAALAGCTAGPVAA